MECEEKGWLSAMVAEEPQVVKPDLTSLNVFSTSRCDGPHVLTLLEGNLNVVVVNKGGRVALKA